MVSLRVLIVACPAISFVGAGADFDMTECGPADLDPHAVSSLFKAFLREREYHKAVFE